MFKTEGSIEVTVMEATIQECHFALRENEINNRNQYVQLFYDVALLLQDAQGNTDVWLGEMSTRTGIGNSADKLRSELTLSTLQEIGFNVRSMQELEAQFQPTADRSISIPNLVGLKCKVFTENKTFTKRDGTEGQAIRIKYLNNINYEGNGGKKINFDQFMAARRNVQPAPIPGAPAAMAAATPNSAASAASSASASAASSAASSAAAAPQYRQQLPQYQQTATAQAPAPAPVMPPQGNGQNCPY